MHPDRQKRRSSFLVAWCAGLAGQVGCNTIAETDLSQVASRYYNYSSSLLDFEGLYRLS